ncbi:hypothetical protein O7626_40215 [Micromonospora sp. WMMD1102]|uniref:hypothetical protein n=1 Tax=Micromonospora sp. WMMD1102 TaxID=3016105 RepID=UPI002415398F|nr:hypothetical protein [Micromonospora sp. WMMD1102]MDG4792043.1 hypothetical protein [Micromonospora sp. WMMD1102]
MTNTLDLLDRPDVGKLRWYEWAGTDTPPVGGVDTGDDDPMWGRIGDRTELADTLAAGTPVYLPVAVSYRGDDPDYDWDTDPGNVHYETHKGAVDESHVVHHTRVGIYNGDEEDHTSVTMLVRLGVDVPEGVYDTLAAALAAKPYL